ncbi:MAG: putative sugar nucleotidyl transferase [candidate division Zixibacteria bacterium]|nr:putative sugar nucleotidyl transferase [candidate division Zixibacteria bacterium]
MRPAICFYEDGKYRQFYPLTCLRPVYTLRAGIVPLFARVRRHFPESEVSFATRARLSPLVADTNRDYPVNIVKKDQGDVLFLNGRLRDYGNLPELVAQAAISTSFSAGDETAGVLFKREMTKSMPGVATPASYQTLFADAADQIPVTKATATLYNYSWELIADIEAEIVADFEHLKASFRDPKNVRLHDGAHLIEDDHVFFEDDVTVYPGVVINAEKGPVLIGRNTTVEPGVTINGPAFIGPNCVILAGKLSAASIGHTCRVGGEVEESIFHAYVNKYHAGFIGHSYAGPWVNFGAMTTNSDLKNNYSNIRVMVGGAAVDTGSIKVGAFVGDHTKFGIGTLLSTGISIGVCCNIFGGTLISDREVPPFSWGNSASYDRHDFDKAAETVRRTAARRNVTVSKAELTALREIYDGVTDDKGIMDFVNA